MSIDPKNPNSFPIEVAELEKNSLTTLIPTDEISEEVLSRLREARARRTLPAPSAPRRAQAAQAVPLEPLPDVRPETFYRPLVAVSTLKTRFVPPEHPEAILTRLGPPPLQDEEAARLLVEMHRSIGRAAADRLTEAEWRRVHQERQAPSELRVVRVPAGSIKPHLLLVQAGFAKSNGEAVRLLQPKCVVPDHYNTWPPIAQDAQAWAAAVRQSTSAQCLVVQPGEKIML